MYPLENLRTLRTDMRSKRKEICGFSFRYKNSSYFVIVRLYREGETRPKIALCELKFINKQNTRQTLTCPANVNRLLIEARTLREFFGIEYRKNLGEILRQFSQRFGKWIPTKTPDNYNDTDKVIFVESLSRSDSEDPSKIYCYGARHNAFRVDGQRMKRSQFNGTKTEILRSDLYKVLGGDESISFLYTAEAKREKTDSEILEAFTKDRGAQ